jgi:hypothetical protein
VPGAIDAIKEYQDAGYYVSVYSSRSHQFGGIAAMRQALYSWIIDHYGDDTATANRVYTELEWPTEVLPSIIYVNDRGFVFSGEFPSIEFLKEFKPWNKK